MPGGPTTSCGSVRTCAFASSFAADTDIAGVTRVSIWTESLIKTKRSLRENRQGLSEQPVEGTCLAVFGNRRQSLLCRCSLISEIYQRREYVFLDQTHGGCRGNLSDFLYRQLVAQLEHHAFGSFLADSRNSGEPRNIITANGVDHFIGGHAAQNGDGEFRPDSAHGNQLFKQCFLGRAQKSVERNHVFPHMSVNVQGDLAANTWQLGKCRHADGDVVSDAAGLNNGLVGMLGQQLAAKMSNHDVGASVRARAASRTTNSVF